MRDSRILSLGSHGLSDDDNFNEYFVVNNNLFEGCLNPEL
jgi:hypothetical protein